MNRLERLSEFQDILADYHVSTASQKVLSETRLMLMVAPSASGRNTIISELLKTGDYHFIVSDTTRKPRVNNGVLEQNGVEYWFRSENEILDDLKLGKFLEAEIIHNQQVSGISIKELKKARDEGKIAATDIELQGIHNVIKLKSDTIALMIIPPNFDEWQRRLLSRGEMSAEEHRRRLETAQRILRDGLAHDYFTFVVNDDFHYSVKKIQKIVSSGRNEADQTAAQEVLKRILSDTKQWLTKNS